MKVWLTAIAILGVTPAALLAQTGTPGGAAVTKDAVSVPLPPGAAYEWTEESSMGCRVTFKARNGGKKKIHVNWSSSRVRTRIGTWKKLYGRRGLTTDLAPGGAFSVVRILDLACNARRRYDIAITKGESDGSRYYYPSSKSFTQNTTIDLGDLNRFFP